MASIQDVMSTIQSELQRYDFPSKEWGVVNLEITRTVDNPTSEGMVKPVVTSANARSVLSGIQRYLTRTVGTAIRALRASEPVVVLVSDKGRVLKWQGFIPRRKHQLEVRLSWNHMVEVGKKRSVFTQIIFVTITEA